MTAEMSEFHCADCPPGRIHTTKSDHPFRSMKRERQDEIFEPQDEEIEESPNLVEVICKRCGSAFDTSHQAFLCPICRGKQSQGV